MSKKLDKRKGSDGSLRKIFSRRNLTLRLMTTAICLVAIAGTSFLIGSNAIRVLFENGLRDAWTIMYLDLETQSERVGKLVAAAARDSRKQPPIAVFDIAPKGGLTAVAGALGEIKKAKQLAIEPAFLDQKRRSHNYVTAYAGRTLLCEIENGGKADKRLTLRELDLEKTLSDLVTEGEATIAYVVSRSGALIYSNSAEIVPEGLLQRTLVESFIKMPFREGQTEYRSGSEDVYGFYRELPGTNLVLFVERKKLAVIRPVLAAVAEGAAVTLGIIVFVGIAVQIPLRRVVAPVRELAIAAEKMAQGDFDAKLSARGVGELMTLVEAFSGMATSLGVRDKQIAILNEERLTKIRLDQELNVARAIQTYFLSRADIPRSSGLEIFHEYLPASEVAGDWYSSNFCLERNELALAVVDVTGHGVGSAMLTPVIAVIFNEMTANSNRFDIGLFLTRVNQAFYRMGNGAATATGVALCVDVTNKTLEYAVAGHPLPIGLSKGAPVIHKKSRLPTSIIGFEPTIEIVRTTMSFTAGQGFMVFSDGLFVTGGAANSMQLKNAKKVAATVASMPRWSAKTIGEYVVKKWKAETAGAEDEDDLCVIVGMFT